MRKGPFLTSEFISTTFSTAADNADFGNLPAFHRVGVERDPLYKDVLQLSDSSRCQQIGQPGNTSLEVDSVNAGPHCLYGVVTLILFLEAAGDTLLN
jgi:hypothetical protein